MLLFEQFQILTAFINVCRKVKGDNMYGLAKNIDLNGMTQVFDYMAVNSKKVANQLVNSGLHTDVNPSFISKNMPDMFTSSGELTSKGQKYMNEQMIRSGLDPKTATLKEFANALLDTLKNPSVKK